MTEKLLTFQKFCVIDDIAKALIIDPYLNIKVFKLGILINVEHIICCPTPDFLSRTLTQFLQTLNYDETIQMLLTCLNEEKILSIIDKQYLEIHMRRYLKLLDSNNGFLVTKTSQYKGKENQVKIIASKAISKKVKVDVLCGNYMKLSTEDETLLEKLNKDFSIMYSLRHKCSKILLGTVAFINHDCNPNSAYSSMTSNKVQIITIKNIQMGDEVTVQYGNDYFEKNNDLCECKTCENASSGASEPKNISINHCINDCMNSNNLNTQQLFPSNEFINNLIKYKKLIDEHVEDSNLIKKEQRQVNDKKDNYGLAYNNNLYKKLIHFFRKSEILDLQDIKDVDPTDAQLCEIAENVYKDKHKKNNLAVLKFMRMYILYILNDVKNNMTEIIAPEEKNAELYETKLIEISILHCYEDFFNCIFKSKALGTKEKKLIFEKIKNENDDINKQKRKLDNYLNLYKIHLQLKSKNIVNTVLTEFFINDAKTKKPINILESVKSNSKLNLSSDNSYDQERHTTKYNQKHLQSEIQKFHGIIILRGRRSGRKNILQLSRYMMVWYGLVALEDKKNLLYRQR